MWEGGWEPSKGQLDVAPKHRCDITALKVLQGGKAAAMQIGSKQVSMFSTPSSPAEVHMHQLWVFTQIREKKEDQSRGKE